MKCYFCEKEGISNERSGWGKIINTYDCPRCGRVILTFEAASDLKGYLTNKNKSILSICLRNYNEKKDYRSTQKQLTLHDLDQFLNSYHEMDALEKIDNALLILEQKSNFIGDKVRVYIGNDYPYYHCIGLDELSMILRFLYMEDYISTVSGTFFPDDPFFITTKGYGRLAELRKVNEDSRQCFVAMWFADEMNEVFENAIKPAIEYLEEDQTEPRFKALRISDKEHTNDINDEIIAEIRRSKFMVCDLTGYRGGVYWEAGFAYGIGLEVIYTCREDWLKTIENELFDKDGNKIRVKREGIHFDLEHRNRIQWKKDDLDDFRVKLTNRIKAVIV